MVIKNRIIEVFIEDLLIMVNKVLEDRHVSNYRTNGIKGLGEYLLVLGTNF